MLKKNKTLILIPLFLLVLFLVFSFGVGEVLAQGDNKVYLAQEGGERTEEGGDRNVEGGGRTPKAELQNPIGETSISKIIGKIIQVILGLVGTISLVMFIYAGVVWLTARGNSEAIKKGRDTMVWAVVGLLVVFSSYIILKFVFDKLTL